MKKFILSFALFIGALSISETASAKGFIIYSDGEKIEITHKLPDDALLDGEHVNIGVMYKQFSIFWIPMWNYGEKTFVIVNDEKDTYWDFTEEDRQLIAESFNIILPDEPQIGFWNRIGGKLIWGLVALFIIWGIIPSKKKKAKKAAAKQNDGWEKA